MLLWYFCTDVTYPLTPTPFGELPVGGTVSTTYLIGETDFLVSQHIPAPF